MASTLSGFVSYYENRENYYHYFYDGTLYTTLDTSTTRNILTTVFVILNLTIEVVGAFFLKSRNLHRLSKKRETDRKVPINHLTSWISLTSTITYTWNTFQLPGGKYGLLMFLTGIFALAHQYFVNSFILPTSLQSSCTFEFGIVTTYLPEGGVIPSSTFSAANTIYNAQYQVWVNGGEMGIYQKVNYTSVTFTPTLEDVLGGWNCSYEPDTTIAWTDWVDQASFYAFLQQNSFLFETWVEAGAASINGSTEKGFMVWSADQLDDSTEQWNLRALIATNLTGLSVPVTNLECQLVAGEGWTPPVMPSNRSLTEWAAKTYGFLTSIEPDAYGFFMEWILDGMVMLTGSGNSDILDSSYLPAGASTSYGCSVQGTEIRPEIWAILGAVLLIFIILFVGDIFFFVVRLFQHFPDQAEAAPSGVQGPQRDSYNTDLIKAAPSSVQEEHRDRCHADLAEAAPSSVQEWQLALLKEVTNDKNIKARQMRHYLYGWDIDERKYVLRRKEAFLSITFSPAIP